MIVVVSYHDDENPQLIDITDSSLKEQYKEISDIVKCNDFTIWTAGRTVAFVANPPDLQKPSRLIFEDAQLYGNVVFCMIDGWDYLHPFEEESQEMLLYRLKNQNHFDYSDFAEL